MNVKVSSAIASLEQEVLKTLLGGQLQPAEIASILGTEVITERPNGNATGKQNPIIIGVLWGLERRKLVKQPNPRDPWEITDSGKKHIQLKRGTNMAEFNVNLDEVDFNNFIVDQVQLPFFHPEPEEEEQETAEGEHRYFVYAWRWCGNKGFAKIGRTRKGLKGVEDRMITTYHPTDDPVLLGVRKCADAEESHKIEQYILNGLGRTRPDREWVEIDEKFNEMIDKSFMESQIEKLTNREELPFGERLPL